MQARKQPVSFSDLLKMEYRWPRRGDRLFVASGEPAKDATFSDWSHSRQVFMADGYKAAADYLVDEAIADEIARYSLIYPIIFCYRQFIELSLKSQISRYGHLVGIPEPRNTHDLKKLLRSFRKMCHPYGPGDTQAIITVSKCILEFDRMDHTSFTFRYATNKNGDPYPIHADGVDLNRLKDVMEGVGGFFDGSDGFLSHLASAGP